MSDEKITTLSGLTGEEKNKPKVTVSEVSEKDIRDEMGVPDTKEDTKDIMIDVMAMADKKQKDLEEKATDILRNAAIDSEVYGDDDEEDDEPIAAVPSTDVAEEQGSFSDLLDDMEDIELEMEEEDEEEEDNLQQIIKEKLQGKLKPVTDKIDLASFTVANDTVSVFDAFKSGKFESVKKTDWYLPSTGVVMTVKPFKGVDIMNLNPQNSTQNQINTYRNIYKMIYDHILNENKPEFEKFLKLVKFDDIPHLYYAIYKASFEGVNSMPYQCTNKNCEEIFVEEDIPMDEVLSWKSEELEKEFKAHLEEDDSVFKPRVYEAIRLQISDDIVVELRHPTIFNVIFENLYLEEKVREKYSDIISIISYIDNIYSIDREAGALIPIKVKVDKKDFAKSVKYRVVTYSKVLNALTSDQYYTLAAAIGNVSEDQPLEYVIPARTCPKCGTVVEETVSSPEALIFSRHQLGAMANI